MVDFQKLKRTLTCSKNPEKEGKTEDNSTYQIFWICPID